MLLMFFINMRHAWRHCLMPPHCAPTPFAAHADARQDAAIRRAATIDCRRSLFLSFSDAHSSPSAATLPYAAAPRHY
jgi:hypothetical protein